MTKQWEHGYDLWLQGGTAPIEHYETWADAVEGRATGQAQGFRCYIKRGEPIVEVVIAANRQQMAKALGRKVTP